MNAYPQGSQWRKWDLHIHTPASVLLNEFGGDWDSYVQKLFRTLITKNVAVVGITDYFSIEGYRKIREEYLDKPSKLAELFTPAEMEAIGKILVVPNIEFRADVFVGSNSVNFHVLFSDEVRIADIQEKFLEEIDFVYEGDLNQPDKTRKLRDVNLVELGKQLKEQNASFHGTDLFIGMQNAVVDHGQVTQILADKDNTFGEKYVFVTVADEDLSDISWNSRDHQTRKVLIQKANFLFASNSRTRDWGLGKNPYTEGPVKFEEEFKSLKPSLHGSDAHKFDFIAHPCAKRSDANHDCVAHAQNCELRFCWIKADPTFEGLKQVLYEPEQRTKIQEDDPTPVKSSQTISAFGITKAQLEPELEFDDTRVILNEGLVAVTGGKGGGKTAFVDLIANMYENRAVSKDKNSFVKRISENRDPEKLFTTIELQDGQTLQKEVKENKFLEGAAIVYVAQGELEKHVEDPAHLESYINSLIFESNEIRDSELLFDYTNINEEVSGIDKSIKLANKAIFDLENQTAPKTEESLQKEQKSLSIELVDAERKIKELTKSLSPENIKEAEEKQTHLNNLRARKALLTELGVTIKASLQFAENDIPAFNSQIERINAMAGSLHLQERFKPIQYDQTENLRDFIGKIRDELRKTIGEIEKFQKDLDEKEKGIKEHAKLLDKKKQLENALETAKQQLILLGQKKAELRQVKANRIELFRSLLQKRVGQRDKYLAIIEAFAADKNDILNDLEFTASLLFDEVKFTNTMSEVVDLRKIKVQLSTEESDITFFQRAMQDFVSDPSDTNIDAVAQVLVNQLLELIAPNQKKAETMSRLTVYDAIFADYLGVMPSVKYKKVKLNKLSLGQKATVLIKIYLAQGETPIVIDSHDDHLDNEFIMDELVKALRQAKQYRQIIIVSNNGNVVVNSDAEQVVIASRDEEGKITYLSGSIENPALRPKLLKVLEGGEQAFSKRRQKYRLLA